MHSPTESDFNLLKRVLRYLRGTSTMGLQLHRDSDLSLVSYSDSDWAGCHDTRRSTGGFCALLGSNIISWSAKRQPTVSRSSTEAEYRALSTAASELTWISFFLRDLRIPQSNPAIIRCDNLSAVDLSANRVFHSRSKHIEIDYRYVRERVALVCGGGGMNVSTNRGDERLGQDKLTPGPTTEAHLAGPRRTSCHLKQNYKSFTV